MNKWKFVFTEYDINISFVECFIVEDVCFVFQLYNEEILDLFDNTRDPSERVSHATNTHTRTHPPTHTYRTYTYANINATHMYTHTNVTHKKRVSHTLTHTHTHSHTLTYTPHPNTHTHLHTPPQYTHSRA